MSGADKDAPGSLLGFIGQLRKAGISYRLHTVRDAVMVVVNVPGERWEMEFFEDGEVEVERFVSQGVDGATPEALGAMIEEHGG